MRTQFIVCGHGLFPYDMLRYDQCCWPITVTAVANIEPQVGSHTREVTLGSNKFTHQLTPARWSSFGWSITDMQPTVQS